MGNKDPVNILLVDDQPAKLLSYRAILDELGENLISAGSAREAFTHLLKNNIALILIDVIMPELDGYAVCERLRENETTAVLPVIMVTSSVGEDKTRAIEAGADDFVGKSSDMAVLKGRIRALLRRAIFSTAQAKSARHSVLIDDFAFAGIGEVGLLRFRE